MSIEAPTSDADLLDLLRTEGSLSVDELARAIEVTPTGIRQRLMRLMAQQLTQRRIPISIEDLARGTVITQHACSYPELAEQDPDVCRMEKLLLSELVGHNVELTRCRLEGAADCQFRAEQPTDTSCAATKDSNGKAPGGSGTAGDRIAG